MDMLHACRSRVIVIVGKGLCPELFHAASQHLDREVVLRDVLEHCDSPLSAKLKEILFVFFFNQEFVKRQQCSVVSFYTDMHMSERISGSCP